MAFDIISLRRVAVGVEEINCQVGAANSNPATTMRDAHELQSQWLKIQQSLRDLGVFDKTQGNEQEKDQLKVASLHLLNRIKQLQEEIPIKEKMKALVQEGISRAHSLHALQGLIGRVSHLSLPAPSSAFTIYQEEMLGILRQYEQAQIALSKTDQSYKKQKKELEEGIHSLEESVSVPEDPYQDECASIRQEREVALQEIDTRHDEMQKRLAQMNMEWPDRKAKLEKEVSQAFGDFLQASNEIAQCAAAVREHESFEQSMDELLYELEEVEHRHQVLSEELASSTPSAKGLWQSVKGLWQSFVQATKPTVEKAGQSFVQATKPAVEEPIQSFAQAHYKIQQIFQNALQELNEESDDESVPPVGLKRPYEQLQRELEDCKRQYQSLRSTIAERQTAHKNGDQGEALPVLREKGEQSCKKYVQCTNELQNTQKEFSQRQQRLNESIAQCSLERETAFGRSIRMWRQLGDDTAGFLERAEHEDVQAPKPPRVDREVEQLLQSKKEALEQLEEIQGFQLDAQIAECERLYNLLASFGGVREVDQQDREEVAEEIPTPPPVIVRTPIAREETRQPKVHVQEVFPVISSETAHRISRNSPRFLLQLATDLEKGNSDIQLWKAGYHWVREDIKAEIRSKLSLSAAEEWEEFNNLQAFAAAIRNCSSVVKWERKQEEKQLGKASGQ